MSRENNGRFTIGAAAVLLAFITLTLTACGGLGGEPEIVATQVLQPPPTPAPVSSSIPANPPDLANGARIFAQNCTACHGIDGAGQGELVLSGQVNNPGNFQDREQVADQTPREWYNVITNGRIENLMPPWRDALTEQERWDVTMYTYTMHYNQDHLAIGERLYQECSECHGLLGAGDGPEAADLGTDVRDLTDQTAMVTLSDRNMYNIINEGFPDVMPAYGEVFNEEELWSVVAYTRTLHLGENAFNVMADDESAMPVAQVATEAPPAPDATPDAVPPAETLPTLEPLAERTTLDITGMVTNATPDGPVPPGLAATLLVFGPDQLLLEDLRRETTTDEDGSFVFEDVIIRDDAFYMVTVDYQGRGFPSEIVQGDPNAQGFELPVEIYELTDDPSVVTVRAQVSQVSVVGDSVEVQYTVQYRNNSDRIFTSLELDEASERFRTVAIPLPPGATPVDFDAPNRYLFDDTQDIVYDTVPLLPGEERFSQIFYVVQYGGGAIIEYPTAYRLDGQVRVLVETPTINVDGEQFPRVGEQEIGGVTYQEYGQRLTLEPGSLIRYELTGEAAEAIAQVDSSVQQGPTGEDLLGVLVIVVAAFVFMTLLIVIVNNRRRANSPDANRDILIDALVQQIAELDEAHDRGEINHDVYQRRRATLKARLAELIDGGSNS